MKKNKKEPEENKKNKKKGRILSYDKEVQEERKSI